jgi:hypothetical protein
MERLYFRIDSFVGNRNHLQGLQFSIHFLRPQEWRIVFPVKFPEEAEQSFTLGGRSESGPLPPKRFTSICTGQIAELSIPFPELGFRPKERADFFLRVEKGDLEVERYPRSGYLTMVIPDRDFDNHLWHA